MQRHLALIAAAAISVATPQVATSDTLVELYTSQGCSSCPPADKLLGQLATKPGVIALSLHVDYWDYLGWKDSFSNPAFTNRQRSYAQTAGSTMIYTPQIVVGGRDFLVGSKAMEVAESVMKHADLVAPVEIALMRKDDSLQVQADARGTLPDQMVVYLIQYSPREDVKIKSGENAGKKITYHNVVMSWTELGRWDGAQSLSLSGPVSGDMPAVVVVQDGPSGPVLAAARID